MGPNSFLFMHKQVTPAQIREAEKSLKIMESMIDVMTPGYISYFEVSKDTCYLNMHTSSG